MRYFIFILALVLGGCSGVAHGQNSQFTALTGGRIIDGTGAPAVIDGVVLIESNIIKAVGASGTISIPEGAKIIDTNGMTIMPGLIDVHVHFDIIGHADYEHWFGAYSNRMRSEIFPAAAKAMLHAGVTSVRDLGSDIDNIFWLKEQINSGAMPGPRTFIAGPFLRKTVTSYVDKDYVDTWTINGPEDARRKVRKLKDMGADVIKTQDENLTLKELAAIFDEAKKQGLRTASHIYSAKGIRTALKAGLGNYGTIEHIGDGTPTAYDDDIIHMILAQNAVMAPTIVALEGVQKIVDNPELTDDPRWKQFIPGDIFADIRSSYRDEDLATHPIFIRAANTRAGRAKKLRQLSDAGAIFAISSDSGTRGNPHHDAMWREMIFTQQVTGKSNMDILTMATGGNALILGQSQTLGTLTVGKLADIIIIDGDPLSYLADMRRVKHVIKDGKLVR